MNYSLKTTKVPTKPGYGDHQLCEIFQGEEKIGEFTRCYSCCGKSTFAPFHHKGVDYALFSRDYQLIEVMTLPDCKIIEWDEESREQMYGFCPMESDVPRFYWYTHTDGDQSAEEIDEDFDPAKDESEFHDFAFVAGCVWGDDSSQKVNILDLSKIAEGKAKYFAHPAERGKGWTYTEMHEKCSLKDIKIWMEDYDRKDTEKKKRWVRIYIPSPVVIDLSDNKETGGFEV